MIKIREIYPFNKMPFHHTQEKKGKKKKMCVNCEDRPAVFHVRNRRTGSIVVKADKDHNYCPKCWNSMLDKSQSRKSYKKNFWPLMIKGDPMCYNRLGRLVQHDNTKEYYNG